MHPELQYTTANISAFLLAFIPGLINLGLAGYVFYKMPSRQLVNIFVLILITSGCWQFANAFLRISANAHTARFWDGIFGPVGLTVAPLLLHFALVYTDKFRITALKYIMYVIYLVFFIVTGMYSYVNTLETYQYHHYWGWVNIRTDIVYASIAGGLIVLLMLANVILLLAELPRTPKRSNKYKGLVLISLSLLIIVLQVSVTELIFPIVLHIPPAPLTPTIMLTYSIGTYLALTVYHFFRGEESIKKTELLNSVSDIIIVVNNSLEINYVNKAGLRQINTTLPMLEGKHISDLLMCDGLGQAGLSSKLLGHAGIDDETGALRCGLKTNNGGIIPVLIKANTIEGNANAGGLLLLCRNISEVEIAQEETRRNDRRFRKIIEKSKDAIAIIDNTGAVMYASPSIYNVLGYMPSELEGKNFMEFIHADSKADAANDFARNVNSTSMGESITKVTDKSGKDIWLESVALNYFEDLDVNGLVVVCRDITERIQNLHEIRKHTALLEQLFKASHFGIIMMDNEGRTINVNKAFEQIFQYEADEIKGKLVSEYIVPKEYENESRIFFRRGRSKKSISTETVRHRKDGTLLDVYLVAYPIVIDDVIYGAYVLYLDISNQKKFEKEIIKKNEELTKINRELDQFVYSASHDIRSPLMSILGLVNIAKDEIADPEAENYLEMIKNRVLKLDEFTLDIIHFARNSRTQLKAEKVIVAALIKDVIESLKYQTEAKNIAFDIDVNFDEEFTTDKARLNVVLSNLVSNAIKYQKAETEAPFIKITARKITASTLEITIADNGEGIENDKQKNIFDMFSRFSTRSTGSGLGLYIVKEIIEKLGGEIHLRSEKNVGSEFTVTIPEISAKNTKSLVGHYQD